MRSFPTTRRSEIALRSATKHGLGSKSPEAYRKLGYWRNVHQGCTLAPQHTSSAVGLCPSSYAELLSANKRCKHSTREGHELAPGMPTLRTDKAETAVPSPWRALHEDKYDGICRTRSISASCHISHIDKQGVRARYADPAHRMRVSCSN